jgi:AraC family transcriptional regulator, arabinose operon regulatory protein
MNSVILRKEEGFEGQRACILPQDKLSFCANNFLCKNLYITDIGYYPNAYFHKRERSEGCLQYILIHCVKGKGWYSVNDKTYSVETNDFFIVPANISHSYGADITEPWSIYWVHFTGDLAKFYFELLMPEQAYAPQKAIVNTTRYFLFDDIIQHLELMNNDENIIYSNSYIYAFLSSFQASEMKKSTNDNDIIQQCITYMKQNIDKMLYLEELAKVVNLSPSHLSSEFKKRMKYSPMQLFTSLKIQKACQMLLEKNRSVKSIAFSLGYDDQYHFSRVFKNTMGVSPKNFKKA